MSELRNMLLSSEVAEFKKVEHEYNGKKLIFRQPSQGLRAKIIEKCINEKGDIDAIALQNWSVIYLTYDENMKRVFEDGDYALLIELPSDSYVEEFSAITLPLLGGIVKGNEQKG